LVKHQAIIPCPSLWTSTSQLVIVQDFDCHFHPIVRIPMQKYVWSYQLDSYL
jgi:hypothetical protein